MLKQEQTDTVTLDTEDKAIEIKKVTKTFEQWQRSGKFKDVLKNKGGFISAHWDGISEIEDIIKN